jgi:hypothetical protein
MAAARLCSSGGFGQALLAVDYFRSVSNTGIPSLSLASDGPVCGGYIIGNIAFTDYAAPLRGAWTTQCVLVTDFEIGRTVSVIPNSPYDSVKNLRFVSSCACPRQITRYTTCGAITSPLVCQ